MGVSVFVCGYVGVWVCVGVLMCGCVLVCWCVGVFWCLGGVYSQVASCLALFHFLLPLSVLPTLFFLRLKESQRCGIVFLPILGHSLKNA